MLSHPIVNTNVKVLYSDYWYSLMSSSDTAEGVHTPRSVNSSVMKDGGVKSMPGLSIYTATSCSHRAHTHTHAHTHDMAHTLVLRGIATSGRQGAKLRPCCARSGMSR
jgi:hypothetical protein